MDFATRIDIRNEGLTLTHANRLLLLGSCFTDNIGSKLADAGFDPVVNPLGVLYNPMSILNALTDSSNPEFLEWTQKESLPGIAPMVEEDIERADTLIITFGTAWVYRLKSTGMIVANCKKQPENLFSRERLTSEQIISVWADFIGKNIEPKGKKILFTVSPIRHKRDGLHANQLSKSILLLAVDALCRQFPQTCFYFPSYEIMMDELRDYRFYADDMLHPSPMAVDYIWERFRSVYFDAKTIDFIGQFESLHRILRHRPFDAQNEEYINLIKETTEKINKLKCSIR